MPSSWTPRVSYDEPRHAGSKALKLTVPVSNWGCPKNPQSLALTIVRPLRNAVTHAIVPTGLPVGLQQLWDGLGNREIRLVPGAPCGRG